MSDYLREYSSALDNYSDVKQMITKNHVSHYPVLDEMLGFQYYLNKKFVEFYKTTDTDALNKFRSPLSIHLLFFYNTLSLQSALDDIECDRVHQAAVNIRTVYESIPKMYYISLFPEENGLILVQEHITGMPFEKAVKEIKGEDCITYLNGRELKIETKEELEDFNKKYSHYGFIKALYAKKQRESIESLYDKFSNSTHPNITRNRTSVTYDAQNTDLFFELLKSLSYFNIEAYLEGNTELLIRLGLNQEIIDFINTKAKQLGSFIQEVYFFPNKKSLDRKLITRVETKTD